MNSKVILVLCLMWIVIMFSFNGSCCSLSQSSRVVGVEPGAYNKYRVFTTWYSNDTTAKPPDDPSFRWGNPIDTYEVFVQEVSGTNISGCCVKNFRNGTKKIIPGWVDVATGEQHGEMGGIFISANLSEGDYPYPPGSAFGLNVPINETIVRTYLGVAREVNHINITQKMVINGQELLLSGNWYWDMYTGVTTEFSLTFRNWTAPYIYEWSILTTIEESTVIPEFPSIPILSIVMVLFTVVTATVRLRKIKRYHLKY